MFFILLLKTDNNHHASQSKAKSHNKKGIIGYWLWFFFFFLLISFLILTTLQNRDRREDYSTLAYISQFQSHHYISNSHSSIILKMYMCENVSVLVYTIISSREMNEIVSFVIACVCVRKNYSIKLNTQLRFFYILFEDWVMDRTK